MEIRRKAYDSLLSWKREDRGSTAILIKGASQTWNTWALSEQYCQVCRELLRFYEKRVVLDGKPKKYEIDFVIQKDNKTVPVEVKSGSSQNHPSLDYYRRKYPRETEKGILLTKGDLRTTEDYTFLPLPMAIFL